MLYSVCVLCRCDHTISPTPRLYKNLACFVPGATVALTIHAPTFVSQRAVETPFANVSAVVKLLHLESYEHMGVARASCEHGCACEPVEIDAHRPPGRGKRDRNVSIYVEATVRVRFMPMATRRRRMCVMALRMMEQTASGEHRWVLARVTVGSITRERLPGGAVREYHARA